MWDFFQKKKEQRGQTTIITRTKNRPHFIARAAKSIASQTNRNWRWVILHGRGNRALLEEKIAAAKKEFPGQIHVKECAEDLPDLNIGLQGSLSEFVAIHDDDDTWEPDFLKHSIECLLNQPLAGACVTKAWLVRERLQDGMFEALEKTIFQEWQGNQVSFFRIAESLTFPPIALLVRRKVFAEVGKFNKEMPLLWDWDFCLRLFMKYHVAYLPELLANYHIHGANMSERGKATDGYQIESIVARNRYLREDLARGKIGLGFLVAMSNAHGHLFSKVCEKAKEGESRLKS